MDVLNRPLLVMGRTILKGGEGIYSGSNSKLTFLSACKSYCYSPSNSEIALTYSPQNGSDSVNLKIGQYAQVARMNAQGPLPFTILSNG